MDLTKHFPNCHNAEWLLQRRILQSGIVKHRAMCRGCGKATPVSAEEAKIWNEHSAVRQLIVPYVREALPNHGSEGH